MKQTLFTVLIGLACLSAQAQSHDWENPHVFGINKLPYHATLQMPSKEHECQEIISLDGKWSFHWSKDPESRIQDFYTTDFDASQWSKIDVLKVPEGFEKVTDEFTAPAQPGRLVIVLK